MILFSDEFLYNCLNMSDGLLYTVDMFLSLTKW